MFEKIGPYLFYPFHWHEIEYNVLVVCGSLVIWTIVDQILKKFIKSEKLKLESMLFVDGFFEVLTTFIVCYWFAAIPFSALLIIVFTLDVRYYHKECKASMSLEEYRAARISYVPLLVGILAALAIICTIALVCGNYRFWPV